METCVNLVEDECAEISVNTEEVEPRGNLAQNERRMTSFETLVHTALALEEDPRDEHSYAYSDRKKSKESMDKDHCYYSGSKLDSHRKIQSLSEENLFAPAQSDVFDRYFVLPHYRSNDSALDVTGFDTISDKCLSFENIHVKTVDVFTENCILPGVSDPDLSRMTIEGQADASSSLSLPNSPSFGFSVEDHSYSYSSCILSEQNRETLLKDHAYNNLPRVNSQDRQRFLLDHSYGNRKRRDSLPASVGIKRGRSNDDLSLLGSCNFKRKDFSKSPFLDHTYQSVEMQNVQAKYSSKRNKAIMKMNKNLPMSKSETENKAAKENKDRNSSQTDYVYKQTLFQNKLLIDHTYEEITDSTADMPLQGFISQAQGIAVSELAHIFGEIKTDNSDHSYVIKKQIDDAGCSMELSDSGTESLNEEEDAEAPFSFSEYVDTHVNKGHMEHPYFKTWRTKQNS